jgi:predicted DNA-binding protein with PD1-like motif
MRNKQLGGSDGERTFAIVFDTDDEVAAGLLEFAKTHHLRGAHFTALGALREVTLGYWQWKTKKYQRIPLREQVEVLSLVGNVATGPDGTPKIHAHVVVGRSDGTACGGHLLEGRVRPTLEVVIVESPKHLQRQIDPETGLALLAI